MGKQTYLKKEEKIMSLILSTGFVNFAQAGNSVRKALEDIVLDIYGGVTPPLTADEAPIGTKLVRCTTSSGSVVAITQYSGRSVRKIYKATIASDHTTGHTVKANITVDGVGPTTYTYTILAEDDSDVKVLAKVAQMLNDIPQIQCIPDVSGSTTMFVCGRIAGLDFTLEDGGGDAAITPGEAIQAASRSNCLYFGPPTTGVIAVIGTISGTNLATGIAMYFRWVRPWDSGILSTTDIRIQGTISTSGSDLDMTNTTLTVGAPTTIDSYTLTDPKNA
jgi:hypothetical protein